MRWFLYKLVEKLKPIFGTLEVISENIAAGGGGGGGVQDVTVNDESIVTDGVAELPIIGQGIYGLVKYNSGRGLQMINGELLVSNATAADINNRGVITDAHRQAVTTNAINYAVTAALTDEKKIVLTSEQKQSALEVFGFTVDEDGVVHFSAEEGGT